MKDVNTISWNGNLFSVCPHCVKENGWPNGYKPSEEEVAHQKHWMEIQKLAIEVIETKPAKRKRAKK